jgi:hypothetical protein
VTFYSRLRFDLAVLGLGFLMHGWQGSVIALCAVEALAFMGRLAGATK